MLQVTLSSCGSVQPSTGVMLQDVSPYYDMFRLMLARHACRTMLRDEAAKDIFFSAMNGHSRMKEY